MTTDQLVRHLGQCRRRLKVIRDDNQRLWQSREEWKQKHAAAMYEVHILRKALRRARAQRDMWRAKQPRPRPSRLKEPNVLLTNHDLQRILEMPVRD